MYVVEVGNELQALITDVIELKKQDDTQGMIDRLNIMAKKPDDIIAAMPDFDCDEVLLYVDEHVTVYYIATTPQILYPPHQHGMDAISAIYKGAETHVFYDMDGENVVERSRVSFAAPAVVDMTIDTIHAICNVGSEPNESLHFYLGDLETQKRTLWDENGKNPSQYTEELYLNSSRPIN